MSSHVPLQQIRDDTQSVLDYHEELECGCIAVPYLAEEDRPGQPGFARVLETLYTFGRQCKKRGIVLLYHNHDFEFAQISGMTALDFLYAAVPASVLKCELDTCWIRYAGADPADYLRRYAERCPVVHLKDYVGDPGGAPRPTRFWARTRPRARTAGSLSCSSLWEAAVRTFPHWWRLRAKPARAGWWWSRTKAPSAPLWRMPA